MVKVYVPGGTERVTAMLAVDASVPPAEGVVGFGEKDTDMPAGVPLAARVTGALNTPIDSTITEAVPEDACGRFNEIGATESEKSLIGALMSTVALIWCVWPPPVPVIVIA